MARASSHGIALKKQYGQHFLRDRNVVESITSNVTLGKDVSVFEIGPGDGFLTRHILQHKVARLWSFDIDLEWVEHLEKTIEHPRFTVFAKNILDVDFSMFNEHKPWTLLANLPYLITFPILHLLQKNRHLLREGVIMVQEEVAQKVVKTSGRGYGYSSLFFQHYFDWQLLDKVPPTAFYPPPKVNSRLLYFKPKKEVHQIPDEPNFWKFIKVCFHQPRRTLRNNLSQSHFEITKVDEKFLKLRAQQMTMQDLLEVWENVR